jgi:hypothetical protein
MRQRLRRLEEARAGHGGVLTEAGRIWRFVCLRHEEDEAGRDETPPPTLEHIRQRIAELKAATGEERR